MKKSIIFKSATFFFFFAILGFELKTMCMVGRCCTTWAMPPVRCALVIFQIGSCDLACGFVLWPFTSQIAGVVDMSHQTGLVC
jgi:hypothetical protein